MAKRVNTMTVLRREQITPHMVRLFLGGDGFDDFVPAVGRDGRAETDMYVKLIFMPEGVEFPDDFDPRASRSLPPEQQPTLRTYTVRKVDAERRELLIDFVVHGDEGLAGPWAASVEPGTTVHFLGPGSGYHPDPAAPWHLLACDEAGLPAVAAALEALPPDAVAKVFIEVAGPDDELELSAPAGAEITWLHRGGGAGEVGEDKAGDNAPLVAAVREAAWLEGEPQVFIHGEAQAVMHNLRAYVRKERGVGAANASISGYWRRGRTEEGFRQWKAELRETEEGAEKPGLGQRVRNLVR
ncbi:putative siderophore-interacting protein [Gordonia polyisoprenivorans VH2]|uniref:Siderophore-interacting protein n=2 Tax=Gordonia polyisoprenivorans TaxID=84595 RepID=A0A846WN20_9ACTN|nr:MULTISPECIES: siderophore-interacting protein [Gordonia]AFA73040.1 putative siderophore-interacting protein [Gordonia polyisoprenivorans VH2]MDF3282121.1 siderophore-interacting protein [Gordonia sp. N1V]NKY02647.1 siderophore-interacting protein [Gordonia polyisoprenivorans]OZC30181.1 siderophore-interacting protein [Gordonia polyisoprenivorans]QUD85427.1 siderophore-interacting protein [Gordonia polyisoprenivorans]